MHQELLLDELEIKILVNKKLEQIILSKNFSRVPLKIKDKILDLKDIIDRY